MDPPARHPRRGQAAALSIIPATTGAAKAAEQVNETLQEPSEKSQLQGILRVTDEALVSQDIGDSHSSLVDAQSTMILNNRIVKILA